MREGLLVGLVTSVLAGGVIAELVGARGEPARPADCCGASADVGLDGNGDGRVASLLMDVDGDGKMDLVRVTRNHDEVWADVWLASGEGFDLKSTTRLEAGAPSEMETLEVLDVNSDGRTDLVRSRKKNGV